MRTPFTIGDTAIVKSQTLPMIVTITAVHPLAQMHRQHGYRSDWDDADHIYEVTYSTGTTFWYGALVPDTQLEPLGATGAEIGSGNHTA